MRNPVDFVKSVNEFIILMWKHKCSGHYMKGILVICRRKAAAFAQYWFLKTFPRRPLNEEMIYSLPQARRTPIRGFNHVQSKFHVAPSPSPVGISAQLA